MTPRTTQGRARLVVACVLACLFLATLAPYLTGGPQP